MVSDKERVIAIGFALACLGFLMTSSVGWAGVYTPKDHRGAVEERSQAALIFFDGQRQELILSARFEVTDGSPPKGLVWIIPIPESPDYHGLESSRLFSQMAEAMKRPVRARDRRLKESQMKVKPPKIQAVGEYTIHPVQGRGAEGVASLQGWLAQEGFNGPGQRTLNYYRDQNYAFVAVKVEPSQGLERLRDSGTLRPLRISFKSSELVYPVKSTTQQGRFDLTLYTVTPDMIYIPIGRPQDRHYREFDLSRKRVRPMRMGAKDHFGASSLRTLWQKILSEGRMNFEYALVTRFSGQHLNRRSKALVDWPRDITLHMVYRQWLPFGFD